MTAIERQERDEVGVVLAQGEAAWHRREPRAGADVRWPVGRGIRALGVRQLALLDDDRREAVVAYGGDVPAELGQLTFREVR
jgi:hypothetical protein